MLEVFDKLKPGEIVLVEYSSKDDPIPFTTEAVKWADAKKYQVLVTDFFNRVELCLRRTKLEIPQCEELKKAKFIEIGYHEISEVNMVGFLRGDRDLPALVSEYRQIFDKIVSEKFTVVFLFGIERWCIIRDEEIQLINVLATFLGDTRRIAFYFVNRDILNATKPEVLALLEELATTIIEFKKDKRRKLVVTKALNRELEDYEVEL
ncbi:DUF257 domain-containing protein [Thermococcus aggregans]|uniref:DUF257 domain-containing protein n=1 Tax=Thermococcus aggregans TaxID=110163 RepID=A0A9E7MVE3_THEAG|nr:DUF257 family protein [Thermococcus aggregans]USS39823.1 DUF257 domain-containing protein [Thermococcus aggregans]